MWEQYLRIAVDLTQEYWPLLGTVMVVLIIPLMILRVGRHGHLATESVKQLNARIEELQAALKRLNVGGSTSAAPEDTFDVDSNEAQKEREAEKVFEAFAKACQEKSVPQEVKAEVREENVALARQEFSFDGNLAIDQTDYTMPVEEPAAAAAPAPAPRPELKSEPAPASPVAEKKDRNIVQCSSCGNKLAYKGEWAGKKVKCPSCKDVISLP